MKELYTGFTTQNQLNGISFYQPAEGYIAFEQWIGFTSDSGHTFIQKSITPGNVDFGPYSPSLTFGFYPNGVHAFNKDTLLVYGHYGFMPSILYSTNQGNSFKLIFFSIYNANDPGFGILNLKFPPNSNTGYATDKDRILRSMDRGKTWSVVYSSPNVGFRQIEFPVNAVTGFILGVNTIWKTTNSGSAWGQLYAPYYSIYNTYTGVSFIDNNKGWLSMYNTYTGESGNIYYTSNGGTNWVVKNNSLQNPGSVNKFTNDSTGYFIGAEFDLYKTTDSGRIWERMPRDNSFTYLGYSFKELYFLNQNQFWAGGGARPHLELTTNAGGVTIPRASFKIDTTQLTPANTIQLFNYSKQGPAYTYKWLRNGNAIGAAYNLSYTSPRTSIDTVRLIVLKGVYADTMTSIVDTRLPVYIAPCKANYTFTIDTASVAFTSTYNDPTWKHYWNFGDGTVDSVFANPVHVYSSFPAIPQYYYQVKHRVKSTLNSCQDSITKNVLLLRLQRCMTQDLTYRTDTFYTNLVYLNGFLTSRTEQSPAYHGYWNFGDGSALVNVSSSSIPSYPTHKFDSAKTYQVCFSIVNDSTGCVSTTCKPLTINMVNNCDATFRILNINDSAAFLNNYVDTAVNFRGKPFANNRGKRNTWTINNWQTFNTGNKNTFNNSLKRPANSGDASVFNGNCFEDLKEILLDSLTKTVRHDVFDSLTGCTSSTQIIVQVPRIISSPNITSYFNPELPQRIFFTTLNGSNNAVFSRFAADGLYECCTGNGTWQFWRTYSSSKDDLVRFLPVITPCGYSKDIYYKTIHIDFEPCAIISPNIKYSRDNINPLKISFIDTANTSSPISNLREGAWYFGDGDSSLTSFPAHFNPTVHTYSTPGNYMVTRMQKSEDNCFKKRSAWITVGNVTPLACTLIPQFYTSADAVQPATIKFINYTTPDSSAVTYKWYFGNGDISTLKKPVYTYSASGSYNVKLEATLGSCTKYYDTTININYIPCPNPLSFNDTTLYIICQNDLINLNLVYNTGTVPVQWNTGDPLHAGPGNYRIITNAGTPCRDTAFVTVKQDVARWNGSVSNSWNTAANWNTGKVPRTITHVIIEGSAANGCELNSTVNVASLQIRPGAVFHVTNGNAVNITANCSPLPN